MIRCPFETASRIQPAARSGVPMASSVSRARLGAPPCSGPDSDPSAATTAEPASAPVEVTTRAVKVEALKPCSMVEVMYASIARTRAGSASSPVSM